MTDDARLDAAVQSAIQQALRRVQIPTLRAGRVNGADAVTYTVYVQMDGDDPDVITAAQGIDYLPEIGSRVRVLFLPPADAVVLGTMGDAVPGTY